MPYSRNVRQMPRYKRKRPTNVRNVARRAAAQVINRLVETKSGVRPFTDGTEIAHNRLVVVDSSPLATTQGTSDSESSQGTRIGDKIKIKGLAFKGMLELNERYSDVTFRIMFIKSAKGDVPSHFNMWQNVSGNKMLDHFNTERYTLVAQKWIKIRSAGHGVTGNYPWAVGAGGDYIDPANGSHETVSRATKLFNIWIPGDKIVPGGHLQYENQGSQPKFHDYHAIIYAYSNYSTSDLLSYNVGRVNDAFVKLYYKDA